MTYPHKRRACLALLAATALAVVTACGGSGDGGANAGSKSNGPKAAASRAAPSPVEVARQKFTSAAAQPPVDLRTLPVPKAPKGYHASDMKILGDRLVTVMQASTNTSMSSISAQAAAKQVFVTAGLFPNEATDLMTSSEKANPKIDWAWAVASRYPKAAKLSEPVYFGAKYGKPEVHKNDKGTYVTLSLTAYIKVAMTVRGVSAPVVVQRTFQLGSYDPSRLVDRSWSPALSYGAGTFGTDMCQQFAHNLLAPSRDVASLTDDADRLTEALTGKKSGRFDERWGKKYMARARRCR